MKLVCTIKIGLPPAGESIEVDSLFNTEVLNRSKKTRSGTGSVITVPDFQVGDKFTLSIPSGCFDGVVTRKSDYDESDASVQEAFQRSQEMGGSVPSLRGQRLEVQGVWDGKYWGLMGGLSGLGTFSLFDGRGGIGPVSTSISRRPMAWSLYQAIRTMASETINALPVNHGRSMDQIMSYYLLCQKQVVTQEKRRARRKGPVILHNR